MERRKGERKGRSLLPTLWSMLPHEHYVKVPGQQKSNPATSSKVREGPHIGWLRSRKAITPVFSGERQLWVKFTPCLTPFFFTFR